MKPVIAAALVLCIFSACATTSADESTVDEAAVEEQVMRAVKRLERADRELDGATILSLIDPTFYSYQDGKRGTYADVQQQIAAMMPQIRTFDAHFTNIEITALGPDAALVSFIFRDVITMKDGTEMKKWGPNSMVWRRFSDGWKMIFVDADHYDVEEADEGN